MTLRTSNLLFCTALGLAGCAGISAPKPGGLPPTPPQADLSSPTTGARNDAGLYLAVVDELVKQGRQGAAIAFLDSYAQNGEPPSPRYWYLRGNALLGLD